MSKLPKAPLAEVLFELHWSMADENNKTRYQYLPGDLYALIKNKFEEREALYPFDLPIDLIVNTPSFRYRSEKGSYPLIQIGPGILTVNTSDEKYFWDNYQALITETLEQLFSVGKFNANSKFETSLQYYDFYEFDFEKDNALEFLSNNLHFTVENNFAPIKANVKNLSINLSYGIDLGTLKIAINQGKSNQKDGIIVKTELSHNSFSSNIDEMKQWLTKAHDYTSSLFKEMTKGKLYDSFK